MSKWTHLAELYGFRCYFDELENEVVGTNKFNDILIEVFLYLDITFFDNEYFPIKIIRELTEEEKLNIK